MINDIEFSCLVQSYCDVFSLFKAPTCAVAVFQQSLILSPVADLPSQPSVCLSASVAPFFPVLWLQAVHPRATMSSFNTTDKKMSNE